MTVSISSEKPASWRRKGKRSPRHQYQCFNLIREASLVATQEKGITFEKVWVGFNLIREASLVATNTTTMPAPVFGRFNLIREASLVATLLNDEVRQLVISFQSHQRSQPRGDVMTSQALRPTCGSFNLIREASLVATTLPSTDVIRNI